MSSAVWSRSSKPKKRAIFERPQPTPAVLASVPAVVASAYGEDDDDHLRASRSSPYFTFSNDPAGRDGSHTGLVHSQFPHADGKVGALSPSLSPKHHPSSPLTLQSSSSLALPAFLQTGPSSSDLLEGGWSAASLRGEDDELTASPSSAGLVKDWRLMQVSLAPPPFSRHCVFVGAYASSNSLLFFFLASNVH